MKLASNRAFQKVNKDSLVAIINKYVSRTNICCPKERIEETNPSIFELVFAIPLAVKIDSTVYQLDEWPLPEITYHHKIVR